MNKIKVLLVNFGVIFLCSCAVNTPEQNNHFDNIVGFENLSESDICMESENFILYNNDNLSYYYIYDNDGIVLDEVGFDKLPLPNIEQFSKNLIRVSKGTGSSTAYSKFYDVENDLISDNFLNVLYYDENFIVYLEEKLDPERKLIIQDPFDKEKMYREFSDLKFSHSITPISEITLLSDDKILVKYKTGNHFKETEIVLVL